MSGSTRTQVYLTKEQRARLDELVRRERKSLARLIREAVDVLLDSRHVDVDKALDETFGVDPDFAVPPRSEWDRGYG